MKVRDYIEAEMRRSPSGIDINLLASNWLRTIPQDEMPTIVHEMAVMVTRFEKNAHGGSPALHLAPRCERGQAVGTSWRERLAPHRAWLNRCRSVDGTLWRLGDMTAGMLRQSAEGKRKHAATMLGHAAHDEKIAAALDEHGVEKVDDLPDPVVLALFEEADA